MAIQLLKKNNTPTGSIGLLKEMGKQKPITAPIKKTTSNPITVVDRPLANQQITTVQNYPNQANAFETAIKVVGANPNPEYRKPTNNEVLSLGRGPLNPDNMLVKKYDTQLKQGSFKDEKNINEIIKLTSSASDSYWRKKEMETTLKAEGVTEEHKQAIGVEYKKPLKEFTDALARSYYTMIKPAIGATAETLAISPEMVAWGKKFSDKADAQLLKKPELLPSQSKNINNKIANVMGELIPFMTTVAGTSLVTGPAGGFIAGAQVEKSLAYRDYIKSGMSPSQANITSSYYGVVASAVENMFGVKPIFIGGKAMQESTKQIFKKSFLNFVKKELPKIGAKTLKTGLEEGSEEVIQGVAQQIGLKYFDENANVFEGMADNFVGGFIGGAVLGGGANVLATANEYIDKDELQKRINEAKESQTGFMLNPFSKIENFPAVTHLNDYITELDERKKNAQNKTEYNKAERARQAAVKERDRIINRLYKMKQGGYATVPFTGEIKKVEEEGDVEIVKEAEAFANEKKTTTEQPLAEEAKKYKSAEEFAKAQGETVYRGDATPIKLSEMDTTKVFNPAEKEALGAFNNTPGLYFTDSVSNAKSYGKNLTEVSIKPTANIINVSDAPKILKRADIEKIVRSNPRIKDWAMNWDENFDKAIKQITDSVMAEKDGNEFLKSIWSDGGFSESDFVKAMQNAGIDGLKVPKEGVNHFVIYNKDALQTKSQLTEIWNKANAALPEKQKSTSFERYTAQEKSQPKPKVKSGKEQWLEREAIKQEREAIKIEKESLIFPDGELESQYQNFKQLKYKMAEDAEQLKAKNKNISATDIDNLLYSQEKTDSEVLDMFQTRYAKERQPLPEIPKETKAVVAEKARQTIRSAKEILDSRRAFVRAVQKQFGLSDNDIKSITKRDIRLMDNLQFKQFLDDLRVKAEKLAERRQSINELMTQVKEKALNFENIRKAFKQKRVENMTLEEIKKLDEALEPYQTGDVFLPARRLEVLDRTEMTGLKTWREIKEYFADKLNISSTSIDQFKITEFDRIKWDTLLAEKNEVFKYIVEKLAASRYVREAEYLDIQKQTNKLAGKIKTTLGEKLIPQQKKIMQYLESDNTGKRKIAEQMTDAELELAEYMRDNLWQVYQELITAESLKGSRFADKYITHIRRGFLEAVKEDGVRKAIGEVFLKNKNDELGFKILDGETGEILAFEKFFKYQLKRTGEITPTQNAVKSFLVYMKTYKSKQALDNVVVVLDTLAQAITPKGETETGLALHGDMMKFMKEWLNTKKGRHVKLLATQGSRFERTLNAFKTFLSVKDLGLNIATGIISQGGEQAMNFQMLGAKGVIKGKIRTQTKQGKAIIERYRNFVGENPWGKLVEPAREIKDRLMESVFILFRDASVRANKEFLLGSLTDQEFKSGVVSPGRLAEMRTEMGRYRVVEGATSIIGATPEAGQYTMYKKWAIPILTTNLKNLKSAIYDPTLSKIKKQPYDRAKAKKSWKEIFRAIELAGIATIIYQMVKDDDDDSWLAKKTKRAWQDLTSIIQVFKPTQWADFRLRAFAGDVAKAIEQILKFEELKSGKNKGKMKGTTELKRAFEFQAIKQIKDVAETTTNNSNSGNINLPKLKINTTKLNTTKLPKLKLNINKIKINKP